MTYRRDWWNKPRDIEAERKARALAEQAAIAVMSETIERIFGLRHWPR